MPDVLRETDCPQDRLEPGILLAAAFDQSEDPLALIDLGGTVLRANPALAEVFGKTPEELAGSTLAGLSEFTPGAVEEFLQRLREAGSIESYLWKDSSDHGLREVRLSGKVLRGLTGNAGGALIRIRSDAAALGSDPGGFFGALATRLAAGATVEQIMTVLREETERALDWHAYYLAVRSGQENCFRILSFFDTVQGQKRAFPEQDWPATRFSIPIHQIFEGAPALLNRSSDDAGPVLHRFGDTDRPSASLMFAPVLSGGNVIAVISLQSYTPYRYGHTELKVLQRVADIVAPALERARAEEALRESEARFRAIFDASAIGIGFADRYGRLLMSNRVLQEMLGYSADELCGMDGAKLVHPDDLETDAELRRETLAGQRSAYQIEKRYLRKDGCVVWGRLTLSLMRTETGEPSFVIGILEDISKRKQAEQALEVSAKRLQALFENTQEIILLADDDGRYLDANPAACAILGYSRDELLGMRFFDLLPPEYVEPARESWSSLLKESRANGEIMLVCRDGRRIDLEYRAVANITPGVHLSSSRDVTERKRAEAALRLTQFSVDHAADPAFWIRPDGRFLYANDAACRLLGYSREELLALSVPEIDPDYPPEVYATHWQTVRRLGSMTFESRHRHKDGSIIPVEITVNYLKFGGQEYEFAFVRDLTERKRAEQELKRHQAELLRVSRLSTMGEMAAGLAHELNQPLTAITNYARSCMRRITSVGQQPERVVKTLSKIADQADRAAQIIRHIRDFVGKQESSRGPTDINAVIRESVELLQSDARLRGVRVHLRLGHDLPRASVDAIQIEQVMVNVIRNAIESIAEARPADPAIRIQSRLSPQGEILIAVEDNGVGLSGDIHHGSSAWPAVAGRPDV